MPAINIKNLSKTYHTYNNNLQRFASWFGLNTKPTNSYHAIKNVSFEIKKGECLAVIGQNGAGKSTLLKLITGTVRPTSGSINLDGKISAMLELGLGFNAELTGRQNVYLAGGLMGYAQAELTELMPSIAEFADVGDFFDQHLRVYSSGMQARLAFALATAKRPSVLIVDEVLSVGDTYFQHKSFARIREFKELGTSILFVSHNMSDVRSLCDRAVLLENGSILKDGYPDEVVDYYNALVAAKENEPLSIEQHRDKNGWLLTKSGTGEAEVLNIDLLDADTNKPIKLAKVNQRLYLKTTIRVNQNIPNLIIGFQLRDKSGHVVWGTNTKHTKQILEKLSKNQIIDITLQFSCTLGNGSYSFSPALVDLEGRAKTNYEWLDNALIFEVFNTDLDFFMGTSALDYSFIIK